MEIYIYLLLFIYFSYFVIQTTYKSEDKVRDKFLVVTFIAIFLLCALRDYTVGRDIPGYIEVYERSSDYMLWDASWVYMEAGYVAYMKFLSIAGVSSRLFLSITYLLMLAPIFYTIKRYSKDPLLSVIIFVCFQFLAFDLSGIRQGLATSICLCGLPFILDNKKKGLFMFLLCVVLAFLVHKSSVIFLLVPVLIKIKLNKKNLFVAIGGVAVAPFLTEYAMALNMENHLSKYEMDQNLKMTGLLLFLAMIVIFMLFSCKTTSKQTFNSNNQSSFISVDQYTILLLMSLVVSLTFNGTMLSRSSMFYTFFMILGIPNAISMYNVTERRIINVGFHIIMLLFFYLFCLEPKVLDIVPYELGKDLQTFFN